MATKLALYNELLKSAVKLGHPTKQAAITAALEEYIKHRKRLGLLDLFGKVDFDPAWDFKAARRSGNKHVKE